MQTNMTNKKAMMKIQKMKNMLIIKMKRKNMKIKIILLLIVIIIIVVGLIYINLIAGLL